MSHLSNQLCGDDLTAAIKRELERIDMELTSTTTDIVTHQWTTHPSKLLATYVDAENKFWYTVSFEENTQSNCIRKMSIPRNTRHAREINKKAKQLINKRVVFGVTQGWNPQVWFNDIKEYNT
jgi:hypothetical protein